MLSQLLQELKSNPGQPVTLQGLSRKLGLDPSVVAGMLQHLEQRGSLKTLTEESQQLVNTCGHCSTSTNDCGDCPFTIALPNSQEITFID
ncbi:MAG: hypothetical protein DWQ07_05475 [Chloroflexi bacterium]|nr:MAG: hypothetical protein DWQ07_05475 [Chloroflexota bacterium]MBL1194884.1 hypothetical protein [Chloroflexota bacterium]NOH12175.1 helix-turn-helix domain-containing protein [Chloroflexota bacterium]